VYATFGLSTLLSYPSGHGDFFMMQMLCGWPSLLTIIIEGRQPMTYNPLSGHVSLFWRGVLKVSTAFASGITIVVGDGCTTRF